MTSINRRDFLIGSVGAAALLGERHLLFAAEQQQAWPDNPFLQGPFAPVHEEIAVDDLKAIGKLPPDLDGMLVRNGPNPQFPPKRNYHMFEGDGMLHGVRLRDGKASYRNRWVRTEAWKEENEARRAIYSSVLDPVDLKVVAQQFLAGKMPFPNRGNTALVWHHGKLLALWEGGVPHEIKVPSLDTIGRYDFGGKLKHACTAHPKIDTKTGELMFHAYSPFPPFLQYSVANREGKIIHTTPIELPRPVMMHDLAITENYTLFLDTPGVLNTAGVLIGEPLFKWEPKFGARIGVLPRLGAGDKIRWFEIEPCFVFHIFNAFELGDELHLYGCRFPEYPRFVDLNKPVATDEIEDAVTASPPLAYHWRLNLTTGEVAELSLNDVECEFPRVNDRLAGAKTRYGYGVTGSSHESALLKFDFNKGRHQRHDFGKGRLTGEGVFVPRRDGTSEDDGYLVAFVYEMASDKSELVIVDTRRFNEAAVARVPIPQRVPFGFHGTWLDGALL